MLQILAVDELHRQEPSAREVLEIVHAAHVGMRDAPREPHLLEQHLERLGLEVSALGEELERDELAEVEIASAIDLAHAPLADALDDPVTADPALSRQESLGGGGHAPG